MDSVRILSYLTLSLAGLVAGLLRFGKLDQMQKMLTLQSGVTFLSHLIGLYLIKTIGTNYPVFHFYLFASFFTYLYILYISFNNTSYQLYFSVLLVLLVGYCLWLSIRNGFLSFPSNQFILFYFSTILISILSLNHQIKSISTLPFYKNIYLLFPLTILLNGSVNFWFLGFFKYFQLNFQFVPDYFYSILLISNLVLYSICLYCILTTSAINE